jgi:hypothetical protein
MDDGTDCRDILLGHFLPLHLGYIGVVNRGQASALLWATTPEPEPSRSRAEPGRAEPSRAELGQAQRVSCRRLVFCDSIA